MTTDTAAQPVNDISGITDRIMERQLLDVRREEAAALVRLVIECADETLNAKPQ